MPAELFFDDVVAPPTTLSAAISSPLSSSGTFTVASSTGYSAATGVTQFRCRIDNEYFLVTNVSGTTWTAIGGQEGSTATTHASAAPVTHVLTAGSLAKISPIDPNYGDGSDGNVTISSNTTLTRNMQYENLTINASCILTAAPFIVRVRGTLTIASTGAIIGDGGSAANNTGGDFSLAGPLGRGGNGPTGSSSGAGTAGGVPGGNMYGGAGGNGGAGSGGSNAGGAGGAYSAPDATFSTPNALPEALQGTATNVQVGTASVHSVAFTGGGGGGTGGGDGSTGGGGGGAGGNVLVVAARIIANSGSIRSNGGNGSARGFGTNPGGGGGGGGGLTVVVCDVFSGNAPTAAGGTGGAGTGTGAAGSAGSAGTVIVLRGDTP